MWGEKMKINLYNHDYLITSTTVVNGVVYLLLQDLQDPAHKMYRKDIESVVLYLYEMQAKAFINLPTKEEYQRKIESLSTSLKENDVYRYLERLVPNMNIPQEKVTPLYQKWIKNYDLMHLSTEKAPAVSSNPVEKKEISNKTVDNANNQEHLSTMTNSQNVTSVENDGITVERKNELNSKSLEELIFLLQTNPASEENDFIRALIETKEKQQVHDQSLFTTNSTNDYQADSEKLLLKSQRNHFVGGFTSDMFITFLFGILVGVCGMVTFNMILRLL